MNYRFRLINRCICLNERTFITAGLHNCLLVEKDIQEDSKNTHLSGVYKKEIRKLTVKDYDSVKAYELTTIEIYPNLNERLYLCYKLKKKCRSRERYNVQTANSFGV